MMHSFSVLVSEHSDSPIESVSDSDGNPNKRLQGSVRHLYTAPDRLCRGTTVY